MRKRTNLLCLFIMLMMFFFVACSQSNKKEASAPKPKPLTFEQQTKQNLISYMKEVLKDPESATLENFDVLISTDSLCIYNFDCKAKNGFGAMGKTQYKYANLKINGKTYQTFSEHPLDKSSLKEWTKIQAEVLVGLAIPKDKYNNVYKKMNEKDYINSMMYETEKNDPGKTEVTHEKKKNDAVKL